ncbi:hypothetical protein GCM10010294_58120 [Streptomyces griseoloalbus]|nr:hypothetical protein GCM10010294_58120 [Streptomyces griseoloalbus]
MRRQRLDAVGKELGPADASASHVHFREAGEEPLQSPFVAPQRTGREDARHGCFVGDVGDGRCQDGVRTALHEMRVTRGQQLLDRRAEAHRLAQIARPVLGVQGVTVHPGTLHRRHQGHLPGDRCDVGQVVEEFIPQGVHLRAV